MLEKIKNAISVQSRNRPRDTVLERGVHFSGKSMAEFYVMDTPTLNTFSQVERERYVAMGHKVNRTLTVELENINSILDRAGKLDFMNLDIEGLDLAVLKMIDWNKYRSTCICVETITYEKINEPRKLDDILALMFSQDYMLYADTFINSIFVDRQQWSGHWRGR